MNRHYAVHEGGTVNDDDLTIPEWVNEGTLPAYPHDPEVLTGRAAWIAFAFAAVVLAVFVATTLIMFVTGTP